MRQGFVKVAAVTPKIKVADTQYNTKAICKELDLAQKAGAKVIVCPELCITGYTCGDLFLQEVLLDGALNALSDIKNHTKDEDYICFVGLPIVFRQKLYNVAAVVSKGEILGLVPKSNIPNYSEFYESRHFTPGQEDLGCYEMDKERIPFGTDILFQCAELPFLKIGVEICEDLWTVNPPSIRHTMAGASLIVNLSASDEITGKDFYRQNLVSGQSARLLCGYVYADAGEGESSTDLVFAGHNIIAENGTVLVESKRFENEMIVADIDLKRMQSERIRITTFKALDENCYTLVPFSLKVEETKLNRFFNSTPFVPAQKSDRDRRCEEILSIQSMGLKKRLEHTNCKKAVIGISGGLDSTLALLVTVRAFDLLGLSHKGIIAVTMPCFGTTDRTYNNAVNLIRQLGADFKEINIMEAVKLHFRDIGHDSNIHDVTYENAQARERTQILMNIANKTGGMVIGTGDMSELALGWATYNGDHMSMYGVNSSVPKTLVRHLVQYFADVCQDEKLTNILIDVLNTPVSPELLPPKDGEISQKTEDIVGPYELHDFYLYYVMRFGYEPSKIYRIAKLAFKDLYTEEIILKWLKIFYQRFFSQQFKRSCLPDGPKVGTVAVSPRGDLRMPSDGCVTLWKQDLEKLSVIKN
ncbi:NAD(+) synthase [Anaerosacchariphilus polymeriproducens]|uniref:Glutamine-dependent NAD(+) synthetase n=1 Tax=Anaerosacchariphilus polymeriproducens TaxID=1812858 RepID=A0A371AWU8_9FIRM|nr:NAD(+) synthase [Anaerosacchariphilus polymeriproducens]RDU23950.1 NAD(+) synthase [Anaerosacchariphilus polymeriproducens]